MGAVISLEIEDDEDSSFAELPWLVTFEPDDDEAAQQWDAFSCGPYLRAHALAIAEAVAFEQDGVIAVVSPVLPALTPEDVTAMIEQRRAEAEAADDDDDDEDGEFDEFETDDELDDLDDELDEADEEADEEGDESEDDEADVLDDELAEDEDDEEEDDSDDDDDLDDLEVVEIEVDEIDVPLPEEIRSGIETVLRRLLAHTASVAESA